MAVKLQFITKQLREEPIFALTISKGGPGYSGSYPLTLDQARELRDEMQKHVTQYESYLLRRNLLR